MDPALQPLIHCLEGSLSPDQNIRKRAELDLKSADQSAGFVGALLTVVTETDAPSVQQAGAVFLKNLISRRWALEDLSACLPEVEKASFRDRIVPALVSAPVSIRPQLASVLSQILSADFPEQWPDFLGKCCSLLQDGDVQRVYTGLLCLLELTKVYRWRSLGRRASLDTIIQATFPILLQISNGLIDEESMLAGDMMRLILKTYKSVVWLELSQDLQDMSSLVPWGQLLLKVVTKQPPADAMSTDLDERESHPWWKAKKWAYFSLDRLFSRYGDINQLSGDAHKQYNGFAKVFTQQFAPEILKCYLTQIQNWAADRNLHWLSPRALYYIGDFFTHCVKPKGTWQLLKDNVDSLVEHFVFPQICQTEDDLELWESDPQEYINKRIDIYEDYTSPDTAAIHFLMAVAKRKNSNAFMSTLAFINKELATYESAEPSQRNPIRKEGILRLTGCLSPMILKDNSPVKNMMEQFFSQHIFPEFHSPHGYMRARACEMMNRFAEIDFANEQNVATAYEGVLKCLTEKELPVRVEAALALQPLIRQEYVRLAMVQSIPQIMKVLLQLANEVDVDSLSNVMEEFVEVFANELTPYAVELAEQLRDTFLRIMQDTADANGPMPPGEFEWETLDDKSLAALGILNTIGTLILSLENTSEALFKLEETVLPVILFTLDNGVIDLYAEVFEIIDSCTYSAKAISPTMWGVFERVHQTFKTTGMDYMDELLPSLDNYICYGAQAIAETPHYQDIVFDIIQTLFTNDRLGVQDRQSAAKLAQMFLLNLRGHIDKFLHPLMGLLLGRLAHPTEPKRGIYHTLLVETIVACLYYNPEAALAFLEQHGGTMDFFTIWVATIGDFLRVYDKRLSILTFLSLLRLPRESIPASLRNGWAQLPKAMLQLFASYPEAIKRRQEAQALMHADDDEDAFWDRDDYDSDEDDFDDEELEAVLAEEAEFSANDKSQDYLKFLGDEAKRLASDADAVNPHGSAGQDEEEMMEDVLFNTPIDNVDPYLQAKQFFQQLHEQDLPMYEEFTTAWGPDERAVFQSVLALATQLEAANAIVAAVDGED
ncbi:importin-7 [Protomyces lactucae-debilis]|uniref:Importin-7 n=1 Tax=Protomyces lactucae-debilis TaxID=2754530 RepID=A0A1Y2F821_PROLT|nr:importin-7 [Protomyces lactucae-debilis]ORY80013.1 importin-7 [Protomyces lactucae-debilis]